MLSRLIAGSKSTVDTLSAGLSWILKNKLTIAIFALIATVDPIAAKKTSLHFNCGNFKMKLNEGSISDLSLSSLHSNFTEFHTLFDQEVLYKNCFFSGNVSLASNNTIDDSLASNNTIVHLECATFEKKKNGLVSLMSKFPPPVRFDVVYENEDFERECIVTSDRALLKNNLALCSPPPKTLKSEDFKQSEDDKKSEDKICESFNQLVEEKRINPRKFFAEKRRSDPNFNMYSVLAEEATNPSSFKAKRK